MARSRATRLADSSFRGPWSGCRRRRRGGCSRDRPADRRAPAGVDGAQRGPGPITGGSAPVQGGPRAARSAAAGAVRGVDLVGVQGEEEAVGAVPLRARPGPRPPTDASASRRPCRAGVVDVEALGEAVGGVQPAAAGETGRGHAPRAEGLRQGQAGRGQGDAPVGRRAVPGRIEGRQHRRVRTRRSKGRGRSPSGRAPRPGGRRLCSRSSGAGSRRSRGGPAAGCRSRGGSHPGLEEERQPSAGRRAAPATTSAHERTTAPGALDAAGTRHS